MNEEEDDCVSISIGAEFNWIWGEGRCGLMMRRTKVGTRHQARHDLIERDWASANGLISWLIESMTIIGQLAIGE